MQFPNDANVVFSGNLVVTLTLDPSVIIDGTQVNLADFNVQLTTSSGATKTLALEATDDPAVFSATFKFHVPGSIDITFVAPEGISFTTSPVIPFAAIVSSGQETDAGFTVTSASSS